MALQALFLQPIGGYPVKESPGLIRDEVMDFLDVLANGGPFTKEAQDFRRAHNTCLVQYIQNRLNKEIKEKD